MNNNDLYQSYNNYKPNKCCNHGCLYNNYSGCQCFNKAKAEEYPDWDYKPTQDCQKEQSNNKEKHDDCEPTLNLVIPKATITIENYCEVRKCDKKDDKNTKKKNYQKKCCPKKDNKKKDDDKITCLDNNVTLNDVVKTLNDLILSLKKSGILND